MNSLAAIVRELKIKNSRLVASSTRQQAKWEEYFGCGSLFGWKSMVNEIIAI